MKKTICIYHGNCADGFAAAWIVNKAHQEGKVDGEIEFHPAKYGESPPNVLDKNVIIVDFSYDKETMIELSKRANDIILLDHHKSALEELNGIESKLECTSTIVFDMNSSGCKLAWNYYFKRNRPPSVLKNIEDRDLWNFIIPHTKAVSAYVFTLEHNFVHWDALMKESNYNEIIRTGSILLAKQEKDIKALYDGLLQYEAIIINDIKYIVPVANVPWMFASDLGNYMLLEDQHSPFSISYYKNKNDTYSLSFRSMDDREDVSVIAKHFGGGGHRNASGAEVAILPWKLIEV